MKGSPLARELCVIYTALIAYATLHPFSGWRDQGISPFAWSVIWPKTFLTGDFIFNIVAYVPLGALFVWAWFPILRGVLAVFAALVMGLALSFTLESLQSYLPTRFPSLSDLAANGLGTLVGAILGAWLAATLLERGVLKTLSDRWFGTRTPRALILVFLWLFASLFPQSMLFGHGSVVSLIGPVSGYPFTPLEFTRVETAVTATSLFAAGALLASCFTPAAPRLLLLVLFVLTACGVRAFSQTILFAPEQPLAWLTAGGQRGLLWGAGAIAVAVVLPRAMQLTLAAIAVTFSTVVVNLAPANPYYVSIVQELNPGRFLNFNGLTQLVSAAWPFAAALYVTLSLARGER
jgi:VanZ family protein